MFRVEEVEGKGKGCLANRRIEVGELILREKPALLLKPRNDEEVDSIPHICHFFSLAKFLENKIYTEKRQFFALNL